MRSRKLRRPLPSMSCEGAIVGERGASCVRDTVLDHTEKVPANHTLLLRFGECIIELRTNSIQLARKLRKYYAGFLADQGAPDMVVTALESGIRIPEAEWVLKEPDPGKTKIKEEYLDVDGGRIVRKRLTGMLFHFDRKNHLAVGPCIANDNQVINFINSRFIQWMLDRGSLLCHAAGVSLNRVGLALAGFSGMGKSTLALHLVSRGLDFVSNDRLLIRAGDAGPRMFGVAKLPRVNPGTIIGNPPLVGMLDEDRKAVYAGMDPQQLWNLEHKHDVYLDECFGSDKFLISAACSGLVILNWNTHPRTSLEPVEFEQTPGLLDTVIKAPGLFFLPDPDVHYDFTRDAYLRMFKNGKVFEARGKVDFSRISEACIHYLHQQQ